MLHKKVEMVAQQKHQGLAKGTDDSHVEAQVFASMLQLAARLIAPENCSTQRSAPKRWPAVTRVYLF